MVKMDWILTTYNNEHEGLITWIIVSSVHIYNGTVTCDEVLVT